MLPPRYILREHEVFNILKLFPVGKFLEIGCGEGDFLIRLSQAGYHGAAYDFSEIARNSALNKLKSHNITNIELLSQLPENNNYDYILMFEVIGYLSDPVVYLSQLKNKLNRDGMIVFSFTNKKHASQAESITGNMHCFSKSEILNMLDKAGLRKVILWNYGYPLSNIIRPLTSVFYMLGRKHDRSTAVKKSGEISTNIFASLVYIVLNRYTLYPFSWLQKFFRNTELGTGFIVVASPGVEEESG